MKIIGVTGTSGKTTTTTLLYRIATALGHKAGLIGTVENLIAGEKILTDFTTPEALELNKFLSNMQEKGCEYVFMEVSSHGMEEKRVAGLNFTGGIFTNLTHDHLDYHRNMEAYFLAKKKFFEMLGSKAFALSNTDSEYGIRMFEDIKARRHSYGFSKTENFHGEIKKSDIDGLELNFNGTNIHSKLLGKFNAYNLLAVWATCELLGFDMSKVGEILQDIDPPTGRFNHYMSKDGVLVIVDYAHKPDALLNVLRTTKEIKTKGGRIISVFGCGGDRDPFKRPLMGKIGAELSDIVIFTSDNSRTEDPEKIIEQMKKDLTREDLNKVTTVIDRRMAIQRSIELAKNGDIILCAGKGHEDYQEVNGVKTHFNDLEEFKKILS